MGKASQGFIALTGGQNYGQDSMLLLDTQYFSGLNVTSRNGILRTRPKFEKIAVDGLQAGKYQGGSVYTVSGVSRLIMVISGRIYGYNLSTLALVDYTLTSGLPLMSAVADRFYFQQTDRYMVIQDGTSTPTVLNSTGTNPDEAAIDAGIPIGTIMAYGHGRLFVAAKSVGGNDVNYRFIVAGDIMLPNNPSTVLDFTETDYLSGGGALALPNELGKLTGMKFLRNADTGSGFGSLIAFAEYGSSAFSVAAARSTWQDIDISDVLFFGHGTLAPDSVENVNSDILYLADDGLRTVGYTRSVTTQMAGGLGNEPISKPAKNWFDLNDNIDKQFVTIKEFSSRVFITVNGSTVANTRCFLGMVSLDSSILSNFTSVTPPEYDGVWTGLNFTGLYKARYGNDDRLIITHITPEGNTELYALSDTQTYDNQTSRPLCRVYTKAYRYAKSDAVGSVADSFKFSHAELYFGDIAGALDATVYFRPYGYSYWLETDSMNVEYNPAGAKGFRYKVKFTPAEIYKNTDMGIVLNVAPAFEFCVQWQGEAKVFMGMFYADEHASSLTNACKLDSGAVTVDNDSGNAGIELNDFSYEVA